MYDELVNSLRICGKIRSADDYCVAFHDGCCEAEPVCMYELMMKAADAIEELSKKYLKAEVDATNLTVYLAEEHAKHLWIPVTERLPEHLTSVIVHRKDGGIFMWEYFDTSQTDECWIDDNMNVYSFYDVTHWMPLPQPPKEKSNGV